MNISRQTFALDSHNFHDNDSPSKHDMAVLSAKVPCLRAVLGIIKGPSIQISSSGSEEKYSEVPICLENIFTFSPSGPLGAGTVSVSLSVASRTLSGFISMVKLSRRPGMFLKLWQVMMGFKNLHFKSFFSGGNSIH